MSEPRWNAGQAEDPRPGNYYVTCQNFSYDPSARKYWLMRGPFKTHGEALDAVWGTMTKATEIDCRAHTMEWGTSRLDPDKPAQIGKLNEYFTL